MAVETSIDREWPIDPDKSIDLRSCPGSTAAFPAAILDHPPALQEVCVPDKVAPVRCLGRSAIVLAWGIAPALKTGLASEIDRGLVESALYRVRLEIVPARCQDRLGTDLEA